MDYDKFCSQFEGPIVVQYGRSTAESWMIRQQQELEETHWSKSKNHKVHSGIKLPRAAQSPVRTTACTGSSRAETSVIMTCRSGRHRSVANAELWSNTLIRCSRHQHSVFLLHLSELDFWENTCAGNFSECSKQSLRVFQTHYEEVQAECL